MSTDRWPVRGLILCFAVLMTFAARGDLCLDELWSIHFAHEATSYADLFWHRHDNNHLINSWYLHLIGENRAALTYRALSVLAGILSLCLAARIARALWNETAARIAVVLLGSSFPLLVYFSEARGYALAILMSLASFELVCLRLGGLGHAAAPAVQRGCCAAYWTTSVIGLLAHGSYLFVAMALIAFSVVHELNAARAPIVRVARLIAVHGLPSVFFIGWYYLFFWHGEIGGGLAVPTNEVMGNAATWLLGTPYSADFFPLAMGLALLLVVSGIGTMALRNKELAVFFACVTILPAALILLVWRPEFFYFRYFLVTFPFFLLLATGLLSYLLDRLDVEYSGIVWLVLAMYIAGQLPRDIKLLQVGRGQHAAALTFIATNSVGQSVTVSSDHDFRNAGIFQYYAARRSPKPELRYVFFEELAVLQPEWMITHSIGRSLAPPDSLELEGVGRYAFVVEFPAIEISGQSWQLYAQRKR